MDKKSSERIADALYKIFTADDMSKFNKGDILVSPSTNPNVVPAMKKAAAIVTDAGGITCHAAIVSREMGIPCIVGTGNATEVLKDGQEITVHATHGNVYNIVCNVLGRVVSAKGSLRSPLVILQW